MLTTVALDQAVPDEFNFYETEKKEEIDFYGESDDAPVEANNIYSETEHVREELKTSPQRSYNYFEETIKKPKKRGPLKKFVAALLIVSVGGLSIGVGIGISSSKWDRNFLRRQSSTTETATENTQEATSEAEESFVFQREEVKGVFTPNSTNSVSEMLKTVVPVVVNITSTASSSRQYFNGMSIPYETTGSGSGIIFHQTDDKVFIVTNNHVINGANNVTISVNGDDQIMAYLVGADSQSDIAVIYVSKAALQAEGIDTIFTAQFGDSSTLELGEPVYAIGNAAGEGKSVTGGMISAVGKKIYIDGKNFEVIQTDAAINPGNSGGALVNALGEVIGINTAKLFSSNVSKVEGMGYAIPSNTLMPIVEELMNTGSVKRPFLGISYPENVTDELAELYGLSVGVLVKGIVPGSAAEAAGIQAGDIITDFDGEKIMNSDQLTAAIKNKKVGDEVVIRVIRNGKTPMEVKAVLQDINDAQQ